MICPIGKAKYIYIWGLLPGVKHTFVQIWTCFFNTVQIQYSPQNIISVVLSFTLFWYHPALARFFYVT